MELDLKPKYYLQSRNVATDSSIFSPEKRCAFLPLYTFAPEVPYPSTEKSKFL
jgi:hypothetical protein